MSRGRTAQGCDSQIFQNYDLATPPMRASTSESNQMRIKTLPNQLIYEDVKDEPEAHTFNIGRGRPLDSHHSNEKAMNNNEIEYFELDLKGMISNSKSPQSKIINQNSHASSKKALRSILRQFLIKLATIDETQIQQTYLNRLAAHFKSQDKQTNKLTELMSFSINELKSKLQQTSQCSASRLYESKRQRSFLDQKYNKFIRKDPILGKQTANTYRTSGKEQSNSDYQIKKIVKTMVDEVGNQYRVTVERIQ